MTFAGMRARATGALAILIWYADSPEHRRNRERHEHHLYGDVPAYDGGELSRWPRTAARGQGSGAVSRCARFAAGRKWSGEVRSLLPLRGELPGELYLH